MTGMSGMMGIGGGRMPDFSAIREKMFSKADGNNDQKLSVDEFQSVGQNLPIGKMGSAEKTKEAFAKIDSDSDGSISKEELKTFSDQLSSQMRSVMIEMQAMMSEGAGARTKDGKPDPMAMFGKADSDSSGSVSRSEFDNAKKNDPLSKLLEMLGGGSEEDTFASIDSDSDGEISKSELKSFAEQMKDTMNRANGGDPSASDFMQAMTAYKNGSSQKTDLTSIFLKSLDGNASKQGKQV
jgi:Ca2+-binding EF-hand superfamily protein